MKRISSIPGVSVLAFKQARWYTAGGMNEVRGIAWHFAQGGNTDGYLIDPRRPDGSSVNVSCHIVVKYTGAIRQIVEFDDASHSLHIGVDSDDNDAPDYGIFSLQAVKDALGGGWTDPNRYIVAIEIEGFFQDGPNAAQKRTITLLARFLEDLFPKAVHLGHRDFQDYKPCPGPTLFRGLLPHSGRLAAEPETPVGLDFYAIGPYEGTATIAPERGLVNLVTEGVIVPPATERVRNCYARIVLQEPYGGIGGDERRKGFLLTYDGQAHIMLDDTVESKAPVVEVPEDCQPIQAELDEANATLGAIANLLNGASS